MRHILSLFLVLLPAMAFAGDQYNFCIQLEAHQLNSGDSLGTAQCEVVQNTVYDGPVSWDPAVYASAWKCKSSSGATPAGLFKISDAGSTLISKSNDPGGPYSLVNYAKYSISEDDALSSFLTQMFGLPKITSGDTFAVYFWPNQPETDHTQVLLNSASGGAYTLQVLSMSYGECTDGAPTL